MTLYTRNIILTFSMIICQVNLFTAIVPSRFSRRGTVIFGNVFSGICMIVYAIVGAVLGESIASQMMLTIFIIPCLGAALFVSRYHDGRFWFVFWFCVTMLATISEAGYLLASMLFPGNNAAMLVFRIPPLLAATVFIFLFLRKPFRSMMETKDILWTPLALTSGLLLALMFFISAYPESIQFRPRDYPATLATTMVIFVVLITEVLILGKMKQAADERMLLAMSKKQYETMMHNQQQIRHIRHDILHHLKIIEGLARQGNLERVQVYTSAMVEGVNTARLSDFCKSTAANMVLSWYEAEAKEHQIAYECKADIPEELPEATMDLCAVLSNALQNALEYCRNEKDSFIRVTAYKISGTLFLCVENSCTHIPEFCDGLPKTTKLEDGHGLGLSSVKAIAERRRGYFKVVAEENIFRISVVLNKVF